MLKKQFRLKNKAAFTATYRIKNSRHSGGLTLFIGKKKKEDYPTRVGFVVSKKVSKRSVKRNRLKRLMRESYRLLLKENDLGCSQKFMSLVFVGSEQALDKDFKTMYNIIKSLLRGIKC